jgi:hypothetical protein
MMLLQYGDFVTTFLHSRAQPRLQPLMAQTMLFGTTMPFPRYNYGGLDIRVTVGYQRNVNCVHKRLFQLNSPHGRSA